MFLSILSIPIFLLLCSYTPLVHGICDESELTCNIDTSSSSCTIRADYGTRTSYLIAKCSGELEQSGRTYARFHVYLTENSQIITLDIAGGITGFYFFAYDTISIEFNKTQMDIRTLYLYGSNQVYCPYDFLNYFPNVTSLTIQSAVFDRFPYLTSTSLTELFLNYLKLPNIVTIQPSMIILPNLDLLELRQSEDAQWYHAIPSSFENTPIDYVYLGGIQHLYSYQFANLTRLRTLYLYRFFTNFTFEENALSGLDGLTHLYTLYLQTNLDLVSKETFPNLTYFDLSYSSITTLERRFFEKQKELSTMSGYSNPFHCDCQLAWVSHVANNLGWTVTGAICATPSSFNGNSISDSSNYVNCPNNQSYHCFNDTLICPSEINCVNTADSAYCECVDGYTLNATNNLCVDTNECSGTNNCQHNCTNSIGSYTCSCLSGFTLNPPHSCEDINECSTSNNCEHNCTNTVGSYTCSCMSGFTLNPPHSCQDTNECSTSNNCEHNCTNTVGSYTCSCMSGFTLIQSDMSSCVSGVSQLTAPILFALLSLLLQASLL